MHSPVILQPFTNRSLLNSFDTQAFLDREPYPWHNLEGFLTPDGFEALNRDFPALELFEQHSGIERGYGQRPHNRYYLAYESSIYHDSTSKGIVKHEELPLVWQQFMTDLETNSDYHKLIRSLFCVAKYTVRYAWHIGFAGCEVSPHVDSPDKIGTHILYFNTHETWKPEWGGSTLILGDKRTDKLNPDVSDFGAVESANILDNRSFLFKNTPDGWHGVEPLTCPEGAYRRLFNIIFEFPKVQPLPSARLRSLMKKVVHR
ncbi:2OG-Fe(II) oxygenase [Myxacorys almedinensis]|uniref:2OG-Fe(II) oxygenase n=1 Tax=Myxacorys almedinensis A TaxID=2690445 RepID=A0A8J7Z977_9CYAN|nr:2OG-Fe(II) oxygenase [Myxacorys almedinensis]NDJ18748.1 2OG-Fe(II) oxygenase [Myxacorys almedinensis A]